MQNSVVEPSSIDFPRACYALIGNKAIETVCDDQKSYEAFYRQHVAGQDVHVFDVRRLTSS